MQQIVSLEFPLRFVSSMDPSDFIKLLEEDDEGKSMHSEDDVYALQVDLIRGIEEGKNHSRSQQFATGNNGSIGDANANLHRQDVLGSTQMKEQQRFVLGNQNQELKRESESHLQYNPPQDHRQPGQLLENPSYVRQESNLKSINNPIGNESERPPPQYMKLQKMSSPVNHGPTAAQVCELLHILKAHQLGKKKEMQLCFLYNKFKRNEITREGILIHIKSVVGDQIIKLALGKLPLLQTASVTTKISAQESDPRGVHVNQLPSTTSGTLSSSATVQGLDKHPQQHIQIPSSSFYMDTNSGSFNPYPGTDVASLGSLPRAKLPDFQSLGSTGVGESTKSMIYMTTDPKFERPTCVNSPTRVQGCPTCHFQSNSSLPLYSAPWQGSVTEDFDQAQKPRSLVQQGVTIVPLKQSDAIPSRSNDDLEKQCSEMVLSTSITYASSVYPSTTTQMDSSMMVDFPAPSGTTTERADVRVTPKMPSVGQKKPLEALGSSLPPSSKKQKLCGTSSDQSCKNFNDVTAISGINLREEENQLLVSRPKKDSGVSKASRSVVHDEEERTILQKIPLQRKLTEIMAKSGLKHIDHDVERCLSLCVEERMRGLLSDIIRMSKQRTDAEKCRNRTFVTSDIRKQINEMNQKLKDERKKEHAGEEKAKNEGNDTEKEDKRSEQVKAKTNEDERRAKAANIAVHVAVGGDATFLKWKLMAEARQKLSSGPRRNSKKLSRESGGTKFGKNQGLPKVVRSISVKDVIAVVEKEPQMSRSTLLYCLYNRICSDLRTQEKTEKLLGPIHFFAETIRFLFH